MSVITAAVWFLVLATAARADVFYFNDELDAFFDEFREGVQEAKNTEFPLPDIHLTYDKKILFLNIHGEMNGTSGTISDLGTIRRTANATIVTANEYFVFRTEFGLENLRMAYTYTGRYMGIPLSGEWSLTVGNNSIYLEFLVNLTNDRCSGNIAYIRNLQITLLDNISLKVTGFSIANSLVGYWLTRALSDVSATITGPIEGALRKLFKDNVRELDFCKYGSVPKNIPFDDTESLDDVSLSSEDGMNNRSNVVNAYLK